LERYSVTYIMYRLILSALVVLGLVACSGSPTGVPERDLQWRTSLRDNELRVVVFDRTGQYRIDGVSLVGSNGQVVPARDLTRESQGGSGRSVAVYGSSGSSDVGGIGASRDMPTIGNDYAASLERRTTATVPLPAGYRQNPAQWHIDIDMIVPGGGPYRASIAAPAS